MTHHPHIHYIFASDSSATSPITAAALQSLDPNLTSSPQSHTSSPGSPTSSPSHPSDEARISTNKDERFIVLELDETGQKVVSAESMSPSFAVTGTQIKEAPTWENGSGNGHEKGVPKHNGNTGEGQERNLMLKIEGMEVPITLPSSAKRQKGKGKEGEDEGKTLEQLREEYEVGLQQLRRVVHARSQSPVASVEDVAP